MTHTNTRTRTRALTAICPGLPMWAGTRKVKPIWILLKQETVSGSGISWAICKYSPCSRQITTPLGFFTGRMPFLPPNKQRQSSESKEKNMLLETVTISNAKLLQHRQHAVLSYPIPDWTRPDKVCELVGDPRKPNGLRGRPGLWIQVWDKVWLGRSSGIWTQLPLTRRFGRPITIVSSKLCHLSIVERFIALEWWHVLILLKKHTPVLTVLGQKYWQYRLGMKKYCQYHFCSFSVKVSVILITILLSLIQYHCCQLYWF